MAGLVRIADVKNRHVRYAGPACSISSIRTPSPAFLSTSQFREGERASPRSQTYRTRRRKLNFHSCFLSDLIWISIFFIYGRGRLRELPPSLRRSRSTEMASSGLAYPDRFYAAAAYAGLGGGSPDSAVISRFKSESALLLYALYQQVSFFHLSFSELS
jgi:hypothetical protein